MLMSLKDQLKDKNDLINSKNLKLKNKIKTIFFFLKKMKIKKT
jgi:hypothetical protein